MVVFTLKNKTRQTENPKVISKSRFWSFLKIRAGENGLALPPNSQLKLSNGYLLLQMRSSIYTSPPPLHFIFLTLKLNLASNAIMLLSFLCLCYFSHYLLACLCVSDFQSYCKIQPFYKFLPISSNFSMSLIICLGSFIFKTAARTIMRCFLFLDKEQSSMSRNWTLVSFFLFASRIYI